MSASLLPSPGVSFGGDFLPRLQRLTLRVRAARERREGSGKAHLAGGGLEFVGYRPYRPGEDLRQLDWNLYARLDRPFVRVAQREAAERWAVVLDTSASMGVGSPGKLQFAAEVATALAAVGCREGAEVSLCCTSDVEERGVVLRSQSDLGRWMGYLEGLSARGSGGLGAGLERLVPRLREAGRVLLVGDLLDLEPGAVGCLGRRGRALGCVQVLAPEELLCELSGDVEWVDPESGERRAVRLEGGVRERYEAELERVLEGWRAFCARHRIGFGTWSSSAAFEDPVMELLAP